MRDPTANLQAAVERLDLITKKIENQPHSPPTSEAQIDIHKENILQRTFSLTKKMILLAFGSKEVIKESSESENEIKGVLDEIKNNYPLLERLQKGDPKQQSLAKWAFEVINRFNNSIVKAKKTPFSWDEKIAAYFYEKYGVLTTDKIIAPLDLPQPATLMSGMKQQAGNIRIQQAFQTQVAELMANHKNDPIVKVFQNEHDAFRMKVISEFEKEGIPRNLIADLINKNPIQITSSKDEEVLFFNQMIKTLPGEVYQAKIEFEKSKINPRSKISPGSYDPRPGSFELEPISIQKGFPHPSQNNGWAFCDELIPALPHRIEQLPHLQSLLEQRKNTALALLPRGKLNLHAKRLLVRKKHCFNAHIPFFRELHVEIARNLLSLDNNDLSVKEQSILERFFWDSKFNFDYLSNAYNLMNEIYFVRPFYHLQDVRIDQSEPDLLTGSKEVRFHTAERILKEQAKATEKELAGKPGDSQTDYILLLGRKLAEAGDKILLQYHSEILGFSPPFLGKREKTVQAIVYKQLSSFVDELNREIGEVKDMMFKCLENELMILEDYTLDSRSMEIVTELEEYYKKRDTSR